MASKVVFCLLLALSCSTIQAAPQPEPQSIINVIENVIEVLHIVGTALDDILTGWEPSFLKIEAEMDEDLAEVFLGVRTRIKDGINDAVTRLHALETAIQAAIDTLLGSVQECITSAQAQSDPILDTLERAIAALIANVRTKYADDIESLDTGLSNIAGDIDTRFNQLIDGLLTCTQPGKTGATACVVGTLRTGVSNLESTLAQLALFIVELREFGGNVKNETVTQLQGPIQDFNNTWNDASGPTTVFCNCVGNKS